MSAMDALTSVTDFINRASKWGHPAVAITDHGVVHSYPEAYAMVNDRKNPLPNPIKLILGMEGYLVHDDTKIDRKKSKKDDDNGARKEKPFHIIILVKNKTGLKNLYRLVSFAHLDYFYKKPRIPKNAGGQHGKGLCSGRRATSGSFTRRYLQKRRRGDKAIASFHTIILKYSPTRTTGSWCAPASFLRKRNCTK